MNTIYKSLLIPSLIILFQINMPAQNVSGEEYPVEVDNVFQQAYDSLDFDKCNEIIRSFTGKDNIPLNVYLYGAKVFMERGEYEDCLEFILKWKPIYRDYYEDGSLGESLGTCYYMMNDDNNAIFHFKKYLQWADDNFINCAPSTYRMYAHSLYSKNMYDEAATNFQNYLSSILIDYHLTLENLNQYPDTKSLGAALYMYAYTSLYLGDEFKGKALLELSAKCKYDLAATDILALSKSPTFAQIYKLPKEAISEFNSIIEAYDVKQFLPKKIIDNPKEFWDIVQQYSPTFLKLQKSFNSNNRPRTLSTAIYQINDDEKYFEEYLKQLSPYKKGEIEQKLQSQLFGISTPLKEIRINPAKEVNAFASPYGHMYFTSGMVERYHSNINLLLGVAAHEATHFECQHSLSQIWQDLAKERKSEIAGSITASLYAIAMAISGITMTSYGGAIDDSYWNNVMIGSLSAADIFSEDAYYFKFKYSRELEIEADIIAYRFCEAMGISGYSYIMALQFFGDTDLYLQPGKTDDHPTTAYRVLLLKYLYSQDHPSDHNTVLVAK